MLNYQFNPGASFFSILVPTVDTTRYRYLLRELMQDGHNVLFMAETGVGKSVVINAFLNDMVSEGSTVSYVVSKLTSVMLDCGSTFQPYTAILRRLYLCDVAYKKNAIL